MEWRTPKNDVTKWLRQSGLVVNQNKTVLCFFKKKKILHQYPLGFGISINQSKKSIDGQEVLFVHNLYWSAHNDRAILKVNKVLVAIKKIKKTLNNEEWIKLVKSNYYSILFYKSKCVTYQTSVLITIQHYVLLLQTLWKCAFIIETGWSHNLNYTKCQTKPPLSYWARTKWF
jgi:hypothetical protein